MNLGKSLCLWYFCSTFPLWGMEERPLSGRIGTEIGTTQSLGGDLGFRSFSHLVLRSYHDLTSELSLTLAGEAMGQFSSDPSAPPWSFYPGSNFLDLEDLSATDGKGFHLLRVARAFLTFASGPLDLTVGLMKPDWGVAKVFRPADPFFPLTPLSWGADLPLASEGLDVKYSLFDDLSLEGACRFMEGGAGDWVVRLMDKSVAYTVVPSFARIGGKDRVALELLAVFPDFKAWGEGSYGLEPSVPGEPFIHRFLGILGVSAVIDGTTLTLECFKDGMGEVLGDLSQDRRDAAYFFVSGEREFPGEWSARMGLVKSSCGGPFLLWPKVTWGFAEGWEAGFQAQVPVATEPGALGLLSSRMGVSLDYNL